MQNEIEEEMKAKSASDRPKIADMVAKINTGSSKTDDIPEDYNADQDEDGYTEGQIESEEELKRKKISDQRSFNNNTGNP